MLASVPKPRRLWTHRHPSQKDLHIFETQWDLRVPWFQKSLKFSLFHFLVHWGWTYPQEPADLTSRLWVGCLESPLKPTSVFLLGCSLLKLGFRKFYSNLEQVFNRQLWARKEEVSGSRQFRYLWDIFEAFAAISKQIKKVVATRPSDYIVSSRAALQNEMYQFAGKRKRTFDPETRISLFELFIWFG